MVIKPLWYRGIMLDRDRVNLVVCSDYKSLKKTVETYLKDSTNQGATFSIAQRTITWDGCNTKLIFTSNPENIYGYQSDLLIIDESTLVPSKFRNVRRVGRG